MPVQTKIEFSCQSCGKTYRVPAAMAGKGAKCKVCGEKMRVPEFEPVPKADLEDEFIGFKEDDDDVTPSQPPPKPRPKPKPATSSSRSQSQSVKPAPRRSGSSSSSSKLSSQRPPVKPPPRKEEAEVLAMGELDFVEDSAEEDFNPYELLEETAEASAALEPVQFELDSPNKKRKSGSKRAPAAAGGALGDRIQAGFQGMIDALLDRGAAGQDVPFTRKISMGGSFLLAGGVLLTAFGLISTGADAVTGTNNISIPDETQQGLLVFGLVCFVMGGLTAARRFWSPRAETESMLVQVVFWAVLGLVLPASFAGLFGAAGLAKISAGVGSVGIFIAAGAFGIWLIARVNAEGGGVGLIFFPAIVIPVTSIIEILAKLPEGAKVSFPALIVGLVINFIVLSLMGGALAFMSLIGIAAMVAGFVDTQQLPPTLRGNITMIVTAICMLCYVLLVLRRWRVMIKPVAWQFVILSVGMMLMVSVFAYAEQFK